MAGFAAAIGGAGQAAGEYGHQIRGILEQRRHDLADMLTAHVLPELGQEDRNNMIPLIAGLHSGAPIGKSLQDITKVMQSHQKDLSSLQQAGQNFAGMMGPQPTTTPPVPTATGPGQTAGTATKPAAQPAQSVVQTQASPASGGAAGLGGFSSMITGAPAPTAQTATPQLSQDPMDIARARREGIVDKYNQMLQQAAPNLRPSIQAQMQAELQNLAPFEQQSMRMHNLAGLRGEKSFQDLPPYMQIAPVEEAYGFQPTSMLGMASMARPRPGPQADAASLERQFPGILNQYGIDISKTPNVIPYYSPMDMYNSQAPINLEAAPMRIGAITNADSTRSFVPQVPGAAGVTPSQVAPKTVPLAGGGVGQYTPASVAAGGQPLPIPGAVTPTLQPHTTVGETSVQATDENGNPVTKRIPTQSTRTVGGAGSIPPVSGGAGKGSVGQSFEKPFTPAQALSNEQQLNTLTRAQSVMQRIKDNSHLMDSMIESGKLKLESGEGGILRAVVAKNLTLTPAEAQFAGDFNTMAEDINLLRKPLGGAGFRSTEAWTALQGLKGSLMSHPDVSRRVMDNTLQAFDALREPLAKRVGHSGGAGGTVKEVTDKAEYDKLPSGAKYTQNGVTYVKK